MKDQFNGDDAKLISAIEALLDLDASGSLVPHGVGGHARTMLEAAAVRLGSNATQRPVDAANGAIGNREAFEEAFRRNFDFPEHADQFTFRKGWEAGIMQARAALTAEKVAVEPIYQAMATDDDPNNSDVWMDVELRAFESMKKRTDVRTRIVYLTDEFKELLTAQKDPDELASKLGKLIEGLEVSMDVSTGDSDAQNRIFGKVSEVMVYDRALHILAIEESRNFGDTKPT
jgi:hypothetical protein